jgi:monooxygenase
MLQRSPTYIASVPKADPIGVWLKRRLPAQMAYNLTRRKNIFQQRFVYELSQRRPKIMKALLRAGAKRQLPEGYPIDVHFAPAYDPWDQRLCAVPDGDLFKALKRGTASIVTDRIATFTPDGIALESGETLRADIVVTATGLDLLLFGGIRLSVDGEPVDMPSKMVFKGMMLSDVPNFAFAIGYTNSSWTLKVDLVCEYLARLLNHLERVGADTCVAHNSDPAMGTRPLLDFGAGYVQRKVHLFPKQGTSGPWKLAMSYYKDVKDLRRAPIEDEALLFQRRAGAGGATAEPDPVLAA